MSAMNVVKKKFCSFAATCDKIKTERKFLVCNFYLYIKTLFILEIWFSYICISYKNNLFSFTIPRLDHVFGMNLLNDLSAQVSPLQAECTTYLVNYEIYIYVKTTI